MNEIIPKFSQVLQNYQNFILVTHLNPDIDGIASQLAFHILLKRLNKFSYPLIEEIPKKVECLYSWQELILIENFNKKIENATVVIFDAHSPERIFEKIYQKICKYENFIIIDHHQLNNRKNFSENEILIIDPSSPSTTFLLYKILKQGNYTITSEIAHNLLAGIYYDTGGFKYENVNEETFLIASELCQLGAIPHQIAQVLYENISLKEIEALKIILERLEFIDNKEIALSYLLYEEIKKLGLKNLGDLANFLKSIEGVKIAVFIKEVDKNLISVSLRSKAPIEVLKLAQAFGGGGHKYASGFKIKVNNFSEFLISFKNNLKNYYEG